MMRLAIVGCGRAAERLHLPAIKACSSATLVATVDSNPNRCRDLAAAFSGCEVFGQVEDMLIGCSIDGAIVATPVGQHRDSALPLIRAGVPVLLEKPLEASLANAANLVEEAATFTSWGMLAFNRRHWAPVRRLRELLENGRYGEAKSAELVLRNDRDKWDPLVDKAGPLEDLGCHQLDLLRHLFNEEIYAISANWSQAEEITMRVEMQSGISAVCVAGFVAGYEDQVTIHTTGGVLSIHHTSKYVAVEGLTGGRRPLANLSERLGNFVSQRSSYQEQLDYFCAAIASGNSAKPDLQDGLAALHAADAAHRSAQLNGERVAVQYP